MCEGDDDAMCRANHMPRVNTRSRPNDVLYCKAPAARDNIRPRGNFTQQCVRVCDAAYYPDGAAVERVGGRETFSNRTLYII